jgi:hypothetical protein
LSRDWLLQLHQVTDSTGSGSPVYSNPATVYRAHRANTLFVGTTPTSQFLPTDKPMARLGEPRQSVSEHIVQGCYASVSCVAPRLEPGSPGPESDALTTRPARLSIGLSPSFAARMARSFHKLETGFEVSEL